MWLYGQNGRVSLFDIEEILLFNVVGLMLRTGFEDACFEHTSLVKWGEDNQWIQLKRMLIKAGFLSEAGSRIPAPVYFEQSTRPL